MMPGWRKAYAASPMPVVGDTRHSMAGLAAWSMALLLLVIAWSTEAADGANTAVDPVAVLQQTIQAEKAAVDKLEKDIQALQKRAASWSPRDISPKSLEADLEQARLALESAQVDAQSATLDRTGIQHQIGKLQSAITDLQHRIANPGNTPEQATPDNRKRLSGELKQQQSLLELKRQYLEILDRRSELLQHKAALSRQWLDMLQQALLQQQEARRKESLADLEKKLQLQIQQKQADLGRLQRQLDGLPKEGGAAVAQQRQELTHRLLVLNEQIGLIEGRQKLATDRAELEAIDPALIDRASPEILREWTAMIAGLRQRITPAIALAGGKLKLLDQYLSLLEKRHALQELEAGVYRHRRDDLNRLIEQYRLQQHALQRLQRELEDRSSAIEKAYQWNLNRSLGARQTLPRDPAVWRSLLAEAGRLPTTLLQAVTTFARYLASGWQSADFDRRVLLASVILVLALIVLGLRRLPRPRPRPLAEDQTFSMKAMEVLYALLRGSRLVVLVGGSLVAAGWVLRVEPQHFRLLLLMVLIWFAFQWMARLSYWLFVSPLVPADQRQPRIHRTILWVIGGAALLTLLVGMGHFGFLSDAMRAVVDRLFMLLLLPLVYLSLRLRALLVSRMRAEWRSTFWPRLIALLSFAIPLTILAAAAVGLAGYINLAWFLAWQLAQFLAVMMAWAVIRHLLMDAITHWQQRAHSRPEGTALWIQGIIDPLRHLLNLALFLLTLWSLALLYTWSTGADLIGIARSELGSTLFTIGNRNVTALHLFSALVLAFFIVYLGIWSRRLTYDLLYLKIRDRGLRNSLSVFTQYTIIVVGLLVALNLLGIDLTSLTVFAGALGVGIGFGLQNIANNFISGLILLAERPVRTDDWVSTGEHQGRIKRIGMRSLVLTTWDNQDVIIPNAQLITNPVTNWTLSDTLVRTVFEVGIRYQDDPHRAKQVIEEAVSMQPAVSLERPPRVLLSEFGDSSVNFRVEFFATVERQSERLKIKSEVMLAIWDALKEADIGIPFPQQDVYIKELPAALERAGRDDG